MLVVISPSKTLDFESKPQTKKFTVPVLLGESSALIEKLRELSINDITKLMNISYGLAEINLERYFKWQPPFTLDNAKQAALAFAGDVYIGLNAKEFTEKQLEMMQSKVRILSGLYGILKPLDLMQPYRLEMTIKLKNHKGKNLYEFWNGIITDEINNTLSEHSEKVLINLASNEYFSVINPDNINGTVITPIFKEYKSGTYRVISFFAKQARGIMTRKIVENDIKIAEDIKSLNIEGYTFNPKLSNANQWLFTK